MARSTLVLFVIGCTATVALGAGSRVVVMDEIDTADAIPVDSVTRPERSALFILKGTPEANQALRRMQLNDCVKSEAADEFCEFVGVASDHGRLMQAGFEMIQIQQTSRFAGDGYHDPKELRAKFEDLAQKYSDYAEVVDVTELVAAAKTVNRKSIHAIKISDNVSEDEDEPNVLLVTNHHARELVTPEVALRAAEKLLDEYSKSDPVTKSIVDENQIWIVWTMNPDSLEEVWQGNPWKRVNTNGVDLNRNYAIGWDLGCGGDDQPNSESYRGPHPFSEAETQTMRAFQRKMNFAKVMDVHSYAEEVRINYGCVALPDQVHQLFMKHATTVSKSMGYEAGQSCCMGGDIHFAYQAHGSLAFLVEAGGGSFQPDSVEREGVLKEMWPGVKQFFAIPTSVSGHMFLQLADGSKQPAIDAQISVPSLDFELGETSPVGLHGRYHLWLPAGKWEVQVSFNNTSGDQVSEKVEVVSSEDGNTQDIVIQCGDGC